MDPILLGTIGLAILLVLMFLGIHIGFSMAIVGFVGFMYLRGWDASLSMAGIVPYTNMASYMFCVLPLFLLVGEFGILSGIVPDAYRTCYHWLGRLPGGLAIASMGGCAAFAAVCGLSSASTLTMTRICLPQMLDYKYAPSLATGVLAAGGTLGILIPPSGPLIMYGLISGESIGALFMAGIIPGIMLTIMFMITIYIICKRNPQLGPRGPVVSWKKKFTSLKDLWGIVVVFALIMGGIWGGFFTPTEAGAIGTVAVLIITFIRKKATGQSVLNALRATFTTTGMCLIMLIGAFMFNYFITGTKLPFELAGFVAGLPLPPVGIMLCIILLYAVLGCFIEVLVLLLLLTPIFYPVITALGYNPIWFGVITILLMQLGNITPPVGGSVFLIGGISKIPIYTIFRGVTPFILTVVVCIVLLLIFPQIVTILPDTMMASR